MLVGNTPDRRLSADLIVVGGGIAALSAALEALRLGLRVLVVCKGKVGHSGNSMVAAGNYSLHGRDDDGESFAADILKGGRGICDRELARRVASESATVVSFLESAGVRFSRQDSSLVFKRIPGHSRARTLAVADRDAYPVSVGGLSATRPLRAAVEAAGGHLLEDAPVVEFLMEDGRVRGVVAARAGAPVVVSSGKGVVLATGGYAGLFSRTSNTSDTTAEGLALAYKAGASLRDLEFVQFHPLMAVRPFRAILPTTLFDDGAVLRNRLGERFLETGTGDRDSPRDVVAQAIVREVGHGRGVEGGVFLDLSAIPRELGLTSYRRLWHTLLRRGCDPARDPLVVGVAAHFSMGGILIDPSCETGIPGLYAAGEVTGGLHGANRLGGDALTEAVVLGRLAARSAAATAVGEISRRPKVGSCDRQDAVCEGDPASVRREVRHILWECAGVERSRSQLEEGLHRLAVTSDRVPAGLLESPPPGWREAASALTVAGLVLESALRREESRGAHCRRDAPETKPGWRGSLVVKKAMGGGRPVFSFLPARGDPTIEQGGPS